MPDFCRKVFVIILCLGLMSGYVFGADDSSLLLKELVARSDLGVDIKTQLKFVENDLKNNKKSEALDKLDNIMNLKPDYQILGLYVLVCIEELWWDRAINPAKKLVELYPSEGSYFCLGQVYGGKGMFSESIAAFKEVLRFNPNNVGAHQFLGAAYVESGQIEKAKEEYEKLKKLDWLAAAELLNTIKSGKADRK